MLTHIAIRDFALIEHLELELAPGMTVLTGETGAGKSVLIDALNLALGDRADGGVIRHGCERAEVSASFDIGALPAARQWLIEHDLEGDDTCLLRRIVTREGRSKGYINASAVPMQALQELGEMLVDIHGQHAHQALLRHDVQRQLLDDYAGVNALVNEVAATYQRWKNTRHDLEELSRARADRDARLELLRYQVQELHALNPSQTELQELDAEHARLANAAKLLEAAQRAVQTLYDDEQGSALGLLSHTVRELEALQAYDRRLAPVHELLNGAAIQMQEGVSELRHYLDNAELDPARLAWVEQRLADLHDLARKHRLRPEELPALALRLADELHTLQGADQRLEQLQKEVDAMADVYRALAERLSAARAQAAQTLSEQVSAALPRLGMQGGHVQDDLHVLDPAQPSAHGMERVEFLVSANPGQPPKPLNKVASGGELSRISLAIQVIAAQSARIPTLIFDEVDVGIGGGVAEIVGGQLRALSQTRQVLCVTHLAQVAAQGAHHVQVSKQTRKDATTITLTPLSPAQRRDEIARMLGGVQITAQTLAHAAEMLERGQLSAPKPKKTKT